MMHKLSDEKAVLVARDELVQARRSKDPALDHGNIQRSINDIDAWLGKEVIDKAREK